jgi:hypothetical protein
MNIKCGRNCLAELSEKGLFSKAARLNSRGLKQNEFVPPGQGIQLTERFWLAAVSDSYGNGMWYCLTLRPSERATAVERRYRALPAEVSMRDSRTKRMCVTVSAIKSACLKRAGG